MKLFTFLLVALFAACVKSDEAAFMKMFQNCTASSGATDADVANLMAHQPPSSDKQNCLVLCILETEGLIKNGKLSLDGIEDFVSKMTGGDNAKIALADGVYDDCKDVAGANKCETAAKQGWCMKEHGDKHNIILGV